MTVFAAVDFSPARLSTIAMGQRYDVIVIGGGHNGLVNAAYLGRAGRKVLRRRRQKGRHQLIRA